MYDVVRKSAVEVVTKADFTTLANPGVTSVQLLWPGNSPHAQATVTLVTVAPDAEQPRHAHPNAEQVWIIERGRAEMLLAGKESREICAGEVVRTPVGEVHGLRNIGAEPFVYLAITTPPADFRTAYQMVR